MTNLTITLPDDVAKLAEEKGLLSPAIFEAFVRGLVREANEAHANEAALEVGEADGESLEFDPCLKGFVHPDLYGRGQILGDIVSPIDVEWEALK